MRMSRRLWFMTAPVLLLGASFVVREAVQRESKVDRNQIEANFRRDVKLWADQVPTIQVFVQNSESNLLFKGGAWDTPDFLSTVDGIHLAPSRSKFPKADPLPFTLRKEPLIVVSLNDGGSVGAPEGFYLSLKEDRGWVDIPAQLEEDDWGGENWRNRGYELTPQTCRAMKKHLLSLQDKNGELAPPR